ncbi:DUF624 domain-containing protein [Phytoactinopolyspora mesophila]|uniref:DUF624 domain-containing protein n=1 Tax=Phytoactinopolyspora mesophila TaxID=2650750 RepID=A0A7K3MCN5_9ACTN|nr:DUF624 domain-containing protein [Phytoactinopolyspora mesophila]NDL60950.1 DUF624 domain-containing protein [Phytoactinopolyspora mesophila]
MSQNRELGSGPLGQLTGALYWYLVVSLLLILATLPGLVGLALLDRSTGNAPLAALCLVPLGPALSAALFALQDRTGAEWLTPASSFWRGYRLNAVDVLRLWVPTLVVLTLITISLANLDGAAVPRGYGGALLAITALVLVWAVNALVIASFFTFRARDVARLAAHYLFKQPRVTLGTVSMLIVASAIVVVTFDVVMAMLGGVWAGFLLHNHRPLVRDVRERFTE